MLYEKKRSIGQSISSLFLSLLQHKIKHSYQIWKFLNFNACREKRANSGTKTFHACSMTFNSISFHFYVTKILIPLFKVFFVLLQFNYCSCIMDPCFNMPFLGLYMCLYKSTNLHVSINYIKFHIP